MYEINTEQGAVTILKHQHQICSIKTKNWTATYEIRTVNVWERARETDNNDPLPYTNIELLSSNVHHTHSVDKHIASSTTNVCVYIYFGPHIRVHSYSLTLLCFPFHCICFVCLYIFKNDFLVSLLHPTRTSRLIDVHCTIVYILKNKVNTKWERA